MRQVPQFLLIGSGRLAQHLRHYFTLLNLPFITWSRRENSLDELKVKINLATHIMLAIPDAAIDVFINEHLAEQPQLIITHFSGCLTTALAHSAHPLQTFSYDLYALEDYLKIPFIIEDKNIDFKTLLPGLPNPHYQINSEDKAYYHALCVMANNFTTILWQKYFNTMQQKFAIDKKDLMPILQRTALNIEKNSEQALTGPLVRNDQVTINKNLKALKQDEFYSIYKAFVEVLTPQETVIPAKAGIQEYLKTLDSRFRGNDESFADINALSRE